MLLLNNIYTKSRDLKKPEKIITLFTLWTHFRFLTDCYSLDLAWEKYLLQTPTRLTRLGLEHPRGCVFLQHLLQTLIQLITWPRAKVRFSDVMTLPPFLGSLYSVGMKSKQTREPFQTRFHRPVIIYGHNSFLQSQTTFGHGLTVIHTCMSICSVVCVWLCRGHCTCNRLSQVPDSSWVYTRKHPSEFIQTYHLSQSIRYPSPSLEAGQNPQFYS